jgi:hypothetical protein
MWLRGYHFVASALVLLVGADAWNLAPRPPSNPNISSDSTRRDALKNLGLVVAASTLLVMPTPSYAIPMIDVNNAQAREFTAFPGLYPTVATKIVNGAKEQPFSSKKQIYAILNDVEQERLHQYDKSLIIGKPDKALQQFKTSQICKYECGGRTSNSFRDEQIKAIQSARQH